MKKILFLACTILFANVILAQNTFTVGDITYKPTTGNNVKVRDCNASATSVIIPSTVENNGITYNVTCVGEDAFSWCTSLSSIELPNTITTIESFAFYYCLALTSLEIPNSVTTLGWEICYNCSALTDVTIGSGITELSDGTFSYCESLQNITCLAIEPPTLENANVFPDVSSATLSVPCGMVETYSSATSLWGELFAGRISEIVYSVTVNVNNEALGSVDVISDCQTATLSAIANEGSEFLSWNDGNTENPRIVSLVEDVEFTANFALITFSTELSATICQGQIYTDNGFNASEAGIYTQNLTSIHGGDSIVTLTLEVNPIYNVVIDATINSGEIYSENGFNESESGTYVQNLQTINGCDSTITLNLTVTSSLIDVAETRFSFYPNPTKDNVTFDNMIERIELIDLNGKLICCFEKTECINIESLPVGVYYLRLHSRDKVIMRKLIKQ